ncbi:hypothetical protein PMAYCL1PPCAC_20515, partial [Pristionchus mayeri]
QDEIFSTNRISEQPVEAFQSSCGECKSVVHGIIAVIDDPQRLAELINALCMESSSPVECKMIALTIGVFIKRLEPYFRDEEAICKKMHLCANAKLENFHRLGMIYLKEMGAIDGKNATNEFVCDECQMAVEEFKKVVDDEKRRAEVINILQNICKHVPKYWEVCESWVDDYLPKIWKSLDDFLADANQACAQIGFCAKQEGVPSSKIASFYNGLKAL